MTVAMGDAPAGVSGDEANAAALRALDTYGTLMKATTPSVSMSDTVPNEANDGKNVIRWVHSNWADHYDPSALAVTLMSYDTSSGRITDADIVVNAEAYSWTATESVDGCNNAYDLQNVLTHEVGHLFGLAHDPSDSESTMYPSSGACETKKRDLDDDDVAGLTFLYVEVVAPELPKGLGCSVGGDGASALGSVLILALLVAVRRPKVGVAIAVLALAAVPRVEATTVRRLSLDAMAGGARMVVRGVVRDENVKTVDGRVVTDHTVEIAECLKGSCPASVTVRQLGGEIDGVGTSVEGSAQLSVGAEVVIMLRPIRGGAFAPIGMAQGAYRVERDAKGVTGLVRDGRALRFAKPTGGDEAGDLERISVDDLKRAIARSIH